MKKTLLLLAAVILGAMMVSCEKDKADEPDAVDMGLSVKWASCNLGASDPLEYGDYYSWGDIKTKETYGDAPPDYTYSANPDNLTTAKRDPAKKKLGGKWRMPTKEEIAELVDPANCKIEKKTNEDGIYCVITSLKTNNSITLPAASLKVEEGVPVEPGVFGMYWSSNPYPGEGGINGAAYSLYFGMDDDTHKFTCILSYADRFMGIPIRLVCKN